MEITRGNVMALYESITDDKRESLGCTMTVADACKLLWNSVRNNNGKEIAYYDPISDKFTVDNCDNPDEFLQKKIKLDDDYSEDGDGYPIIYGDIVD